MRYISTSEIQTQKIAADLVKTLTGGEVIALRGDLGAGKTTFTKGLAKALGIMHTVTSPTFVLMNVYPTKHKTIKQLVHIDCYRLEHPRELETIGAPEYFGQSDTVTVIEWPERVEKLLPKEALTITVRLGKKQTERIILLSTTT